MKRMNSSEKLNSFETYPSYDTTGTTSEMCIRFSAVTVKLICVILCNFLFATHFSFVYPKH